MLALAGFACSVAEGAGAAGPRRGRERFEVYVERDWMPNHVMEASTRQSYMYTLYRHVMPYFAQMKMWEILPNDVREFVTHLMGVRGETADELIFQQPELASAERDLTAELPDPLALGRTEPNTQGRTPTHTAPPRLRARQVPLPPLPERRGGLTGPTSSRRQRPAARRHHRPAHLQPLVQHERLEPRP